MNSTANGSSGSWTCLNFTVWKIGGTVTYCLIFIVSLVANSLIVMIVYKTPNLRKPINFFIANMASSDLLWPIFWIPWNLSLLHANSFFIGGQLGQALCKLVPFFSTVSFTVSIQNLILIAVDRFGAVVFPLRSPLIRSKLCPFFILATWIVAAAVSSPDLFTYELVEYPEGTCRCVENWKTEAFGESSSFASFSLAYYILFIYIPVLLLVILYSIIVIKLKTQAHPGEQSANSQQQRDRRNRNVLQMSIAIVTVFVLCLLPYSINALIIEYQDTRFSCSFSIYATVTFFMSTTYCAINPVICFMFSSNYQKALKRLIKCSFVQA